MPVSLANELRGPAGKSQDDLLEIGVFGSPATSNLSPITSHGRDSGLAVRLQDLFLILSQCVDLGLLSITAAFRAARHLKKILGSGFEMIRIRQCELARVFRVYDKEMANWRSNLGSQYRRASVSSRSFARRPSDALSLIAKSRKSPTASR